MILSWTILRAVLLTPWLAVLCVKDLKARRLPNAWTLGGLAAGGDFLRTAAAIFGILVGVEETRPILYGVADYAEIRKANALFIDRTAKIALAAGVC